MGHCRAGPLGRGVLSGKLAVGAEGLEGRASSVQVPLTTLTLARDGQGAHAHGFPWERRGHLLLGLFRPLPLHCPFPVLYHLVSPFVLRLSNIHLLCCCCGGSLCARHWDIRTDELRSLPSRGLVQVVPAVDTDASLLRTAHSVPMPSPCSLLGQGPVPISCPQPVGNWLTISAKDPVTQSQFKY